MILTPKQRKVISSVMLQADASCSCIARETGYREHTVRYSLQALREKNFIIPLPFIDVMRLGYLDSCMYFTYASESEVVRQRLINFLLQSKEVAWLAELAGEYQYMAAHYGRQISDIDAFMNSLARKCGGRFFQKSFAIRVRWCIFRPKYLSAHRAAVNVLSCEGTSAPISIDETDCSILRALVNPEFDSITKIAKASKLPLSTVSFRLKHLKENGVIRGYAYRLNHALAKVQLFRLIISEKRSNPAFKEKLFSFCLDHPNITTFVHCLGDWDYEILVEVEDSRQILQIAQQVEEEFGDNISSLKTVTTLQILKWCLFPF